jgi:hypothetical protein
VTLGPGPPALGGSPGGSSPDTVRSAPVLNEKAEPQLITMKDENMPAMPAKRYRIPGMGKDSLRFQGFLFKHGPVRVLGEVEMWLTDCIGNNEGWSNWEGTNDFSEKELKAIRAKVDRIIKPHLEEQE